MEMNNNNPMLEDLKELVNIAMKSKRQKCQKIGQHLQNDLPCWLKAKINKQNNAD